MLITIKNIDKNFHLPSGKKFSVLEDISITIDTGDFIVVLGESGCGKSTFLSILAGLQSPSRGEVLVGQQKIKGPHPSRSLLFQQPSLLPWLNVEENIIFGCKLRKELNSPKKVKQLIKIMGLAGFEKIHPPELSLGMAQRVCLARALLGRPQILLMDEPFSSLDTFTRTLMQEELIEFWQIDNFTVVFVTHDIDEAIMLGNRIVLLGGRPARLIKIFDVDLHYPRNMNQSSFFEIRQTILEKFRKSLI